jgi:hypothetical protein
MPGSPIPMSSLQALGPLPPSGGIIFSSPSSSSPKEKGPIPVVSRTEEKKGFTGKGDQPLHKKSARCIKECRGSVKMVVGDDIPLCDVPQLVGKTLVGSFTGKAPGEKSLTGWMNNLWKPLIGYTPKVHLLSRNWISFSFLSAEDCDEIRKQNWSWGPSGLTLKPWTVDFDPLKESMVVMKVWAILPGFPLDFWSREALEAIGNKLGSFVKLEPNWDSKKDRRWAWVMIEVDVREGLVGNIDLVYAGITWHQKVDYWRIPFWCYGCHEIGHIRSQCTRIAPLQQAPARLWKTKSTIRKQDSVEVISVEGKNAEIPLDNVKVDLSIQAMDDLVKKVSDTGMATSSPSCLLFFIWVFFPLTPFPPPPPPPFSQVLPLSHSTPFLFLPSEFVGRTVVLEKVPSREPSSSPLPRMDPLPAPSPPPPLGFPLYPLLNSPNLFFPLHPPLKPPSPLGSTDML